LKIQKIKLGQVGVGRRLWMLE